MQQLVQQQCSSATAGSIVWGRQQCSFLDIRIFYPNVQSYRQSSISSLYRRHELAKKREYGDRVKQVKNWSVTSLVFSTTGGMGRDSVRQHNFININFSRSNIHERELSLQYYPGLVKMLIILLSLLHLAMTCIRGSRATCHHVSDRPLGIAECCHSQAG